MEIIPAINCLERDCFVEKLEKCRSFLPGGSFIHLDISSLEFALSESFIDLKLIDEKFSDFKFEAHLMLGVADAFDDRWFNSASIKRVLFHSRIVDGWEILLKKGKKSGKEIGIVFDSADKDIFVPEKVKFAEILATTPGPSGQVFNGNALGMVRFLKKNHPDVKISVDGGVNPETGRKCKEAGADLLVSGSYLWKSPDCGEAYRELKKL